MTGIGIELYQTASDLISGYIEGELPNKSNSRRIVRMGKRVASIKSEEALALEQRFALADVSKLRGLPWEGRLSLWVEVIPANLRRDLDCELLPDLLQKAGIIRNDRDIWKKIYERKYPDKARPRISFEISRLPGSGTPSPRPAGGSTGKGKRAGSSRT